MKAQSQHLILEGNIGAGKSTFLKILGEYLDIQLVFEPTQKWQDVDGENLLDRFYKDTQRWAYTFQSYAFVTRILEQEKMIRNGQENVKVFERSVFSDRYCFAKNCYEMGTMSSLEWSLYKEWFSWLVESYSTKPMGFIYLRTDPAVCYARTKKRSRAEEAEIPLEYLTMLHNKHEDWLLQKKGVAPYLADVPVLTLDCDIDFEHNVQEQEKHVARIIEAFPSVTYLKPTHSVSLNSRI